MCSSDLMHVDNEWSQKTMQKSSDDSKLYREKARMPKISSYKGTLEEDKELESIFNRTYGKVERKLNSSKNILGYENADKDKNIDTDKNNNENNSKENVKNDKWKIKKKDEPKKNYLLVDGYNIIYAWDELKELANDNLSAARIKLADILSNYQGYKKSIVILVFDAYKVEGGVGEIIDYENISIVFTKEAETADMYIEKVTNDIARKHNVVVASSDRVEQIIIMGQGATRLSAGDLKEEINVVKEEIKTYYKDKTSGKMSSIGDHFDEELRKFTE